MSMHQDTAPNPTPSSLIIRRRGGIPASLALTEYQETTLIRLALKHAGLRRYGKGRKAY